jgi:hypothetical protein
MSKFAGMELEVDKPSRMVILHPKTGLPLKDSGDNDAYLELYSGDSLPAQRFRRELNTARLRLRNRNSLTGDTLEQEAVALLAALTVGWRLVALDGSPIDLPFSRDDAEKLYASRGMAWLREQAEAFIGERANFSEASSTS